MPVKVEGGGRWVTLKSGYRIFIKGGSGGAAQGKKLGSKLQYRPSAETTSVAEKYANEALEGLVGKYGEGKVGAEGIKVVAAKIEAQLEKDLAEPISIRRGIRGATGVVEAGRFRTQHETGTSGGTFDVEQRTQAERLGLGVPPDEKAHPVYGYFSTPDNTADSYGPVEFVLKDSVKDRATFTVGDSLGAFTDGSLVSGTDPKDKGAWDANVYDYLGRSMGSDFCYVEAQIQGGVSLNDVSKVVFHGSSEHPAIGSDLDGLYKRLKEKGIKVEYTDED